jgi:hypothetical protein
MMFFIYVIIVMMCVNLFCVVTVVHDGAVVSTWRMFNIVSSLSVWLSLQYHFIRTSKFIIRGHDPKMYLYW